MTKKFMQKSRLRYALASLLDEFRHCFVVVFQFVLILCVKKVEDIRISLSR
jgi:hypothetical protein